MEWWTYNRDLNVPIAWVSAIREENFGPDIDEVSVAIMKDAKSLIEEVRETTKSLNARAVEDWKSHRPDFGGISYVVYCSILVKCCILNAAPEARQLRWRRMDYLRTYRSI